jgi:hypothetical protein
MTKRSKWTALNVAAALVAAGNLPAGELATAPMASLGTSLNGQASASGRFPTQAMEHAFDRYLDWVSENGLGLEYALSTSTHPVHALEPGRDANVSASGRFPSQAMEEQYHAYLSWVENAGLDTLHAFEGVVAN